MMNSILEQLKDHILEYNTYFSTGFPATYLDSGAVKILSIDERGNPVAVFPADNLGSYFYLRIEGTPQMVNRAIDTLEEGTYGGAIRANIWLVAGVKNADEDLLFNNLINTLRGFKTASELLFTKAIFRTPDVIQSELAALNDNDLAAALQRTPINMSFVAVGFSLTMNIPYITLSPDCITNPCEEC